MSFSQAPYREQVSKVVKQLDSSIQVGEQSFQEELGQTLVQCFQLSSAGLDTFSQGIVILDELFGFSVTHFIKQYVPHKNEARALVIELLYGLYEGGIDAKKYSEFLLIQTLAALGYSKTVGDILAKLSLDKTARLICFLFTHPNEGTFALLDAFAKPFRELIQGLRTYYLM